MVDLAQDLRPEDLAEIQATTGEDPAVTLVSSLMLSELAWVVLDDEDPIAVFGAAPDLNRPGDGLVWMMGTPRMDHPAAATFILRHTRPYLDEMHRRFPRLWNHIDARNDKSMRWLEWANFRVTEAHPAFGREGRLFYTFERTAHV